ncbi:SIR2 family NAD-dependent protein deacylase [Limobrevibacterium gyesilva]|uniref:protein acetyllysine N-acetyltransferase n=1 Tax=Limobrevibacterium gyesilva TaxID=2991712 RepID=A0AA41YWB5_9PROT|nr:Sir2 family NAD-dependent protein deacetylase [Limobrevibacterium gyesilva]MCW3476562.1 Sir2 family NAD-dependent protein deacetylase [Limobrevibacterium gyesilva]
MDADVAALAQEIARARRIVLFTGAGISTESGIPDFRGPGGVWTTMRPIGFADFVASEAARREAWRRKFDSEPVMRAARPNRGHRACARLLREGKAACVITQNIDGLHQQAGVEAGQVIELHGNATYAHCLDCGTRHELDDLRAAFERDGAAPRCGRCRGLVKTATISFGQAMPEAAMRRAEAEARAADCCIVLGSSLVVYPAAGVPVLARQAGARLVIVNREATGLDDMADLVVHREIGAVFGAAVGVN